MKKMLLAALGLVVLAGCAVDPGAAENRRNALITQVFPDPADQAGLDLVFPLESGGVYRTVEIGYFTAEVTEPEVRGRVSAFCARQGLSGAVAIRRDQGVSIRTVPSTGEQKQVRTIWYNCV